MKNKIYYLGLSAVIILLLGCIFKMSHWPGAGIGLTVGFFFFCFLFLPYAMLNCFKAELDKKSRLLYIVSYIVIVCNFISALFKVMHWPGAGYLLAIALPMPFLLFLPIYLIINRNDKEINYRNFVGIMFFFAYLAVISALLSIRVSKDTLNELVIMADHLDQKTGFCSDQIKTMINKKEGEMDSAAVFSRISVLNIMKQSEQLCNMIDKLIISIIKSADKDNVKIISTDGKINLWGIEGKDNNSQSLSGTYMATDLKNKLNGYRLLVLSYAKNEQREYIEHLLNTNDEDGKSWGVNTFSGQNLIAAISTLRMIKYKITLAELEAVSSFSCQ
jgi:hypothetical protein